MIAEIPPEKRHPGLAIFREQGEQPELFELRDVERMMQTVEYRAELVVKIKVRQEKLMISSG
jgi:hypothetical protein